MEFLRGNMSQDDLPQRWTDIEKANKEAKVEPKDLTWKCCVCEEYKSVEEYTAGDERRWQPNYRHQILERGPWRNLRS